MLKIVMAYDGSTQANAALERVSWFAQSPMEVVVVTAVPQMPPGVHPSPGAPTDAEVQQMRQRLDYGVTALHAKGIKVRGVLVIGDAAESVLDIAESEKADLIITGSRGWGLAKRIFLGSVSTTIANHAKCAVMIVR
jgi:nucleotide-binding universal stress UspA family protein